MRYLLVLLMLALLGCPAFDAPAAKHWSFSKFISEALPPSYVMGDRDGAQLDVTVVGGKDDAVIEYTLPNVDSDKSGVTFHTRGDISMPLGGALGCQTIYGALQERGVKVSFKKAPAEGTYVASGSEEPFSIFVSKVQKIKPPTNVESITVRGKEISGRLKGEPGAIFTTIGDLTEYRQALVARGIRIEEEP